MAQVIQVKHKGLYTSPNEFSSVPDGALLKADHCILTVDNILEPRRGFDRVATLSDASYRHAKFEYYQSQLMSFFGTTSIGYLNSTTFTALTGTYTDVDVNLARKRFLLASSCLYFTTLNGVYKLDAYNGTPTAAGMYKGLDTQLSLTEASGFLVVDNQVAYRVVWGIRDAQQNLVLGAPSGRAVIINPTAGSNQNVSATFTIPSGITVNHFYQIYRSKQSGGDDIEPDDELGLVIEANPTAGEITTGTITVVDRTTDDLRGATLYTSPSQEGIGQANDIPPQAEDFDEFFGSVIYANTLSKHRKTFTILATGGTNGIQFSETLVIAGTTYTAHGTENSSNGRYCLSAASTTTADTTNTNPTLTNVASIAGVKVGWKISGTNIPASTYIGSVGATTIGLVDSAGVAVNCTGTAAGVTITITPNISSRSATSSTPAQNIFDTAQSLCRIINRYATNTLVYAYYVSAEGDLPGQILIEERALGGSSFALTASAHGSAFSPALPTSGTTIASSNDDFKDSLMISKFEQSEAVPLLNIIRVGSANNAIRRVKKLKNSLFIFKDIEGIYRLTGTNPTNFQVELFDSSARLLAPESLAVVNNQIWCLCDQGVTVVTETGVSVVSRPIEDMILDQFGLALNQVKYYSWGCGYETERQYHLYTVSTSGDTVAQQAFVFNIFTQGFTRWPWSKSAGIVSPVDDKMYLGNGATYDMDQERKTRTYTDYIDYGIALTITSSSAKTVYLSSTNEVEVGDLLYQSATLNSVITEVQPGYVTVLDTISWTVAACTVYKGIDALVEYAPATGGNPGMSKHFPEISYLFKAARFSTATVSFATDVSGYFEGFSISGNRTGLWGLFPWGEEAWGGTASTVPIRTYIPLEKQRGSFLRVRLNLRQGYGYFKLLGYSLPYYDTENYAVAK